MIWCDMHIPDSVLINRCTYQVVYAAFDEIACGEHETIGQYIPYKQLIVLQEGMPHELTEDTLWHEIMEAINDHYGVGLTHSQIQAIAAALSVTVNDLFNSNAINGDREDVIAKV